MSQTHYYYALNRKRAERALDLTWREYLAEGPWEDLNGQWATLGEFLAYAVNRPLLPDEPTDKELAPLLKWTLRKTITRSSPQYFILLSVNNELGDRGFVTADINAEYLETECDALILCAIRAHERGDIDDRTCWSVMALHDVCPFDGWEPTSECVEAVASKLTATVPRKKGRHRSKTPPEPDGVRLTLEQQQRGQRLGRRFGCCDPVFDWQSRAAVEDGHSALNEADTRRFARFLKAAWEGNWPVAGSDALGWARLQEFELADSLYCQVEAYPGSCLIHYCGP